MNELLESLNPKRPTMGDTRLVHYVYPPSKWDRPIFWGIILVLASLVGYWVFR